MAKVTPGMEKRQKRLEEKKSLSRVTRARTAKQSSLASKDQVAVLSLNTTQKSKQKDKKSGKTASPTHANAVEPKDSASTELNAKMLRYGNDVEVKNNHSEKNGDKSLKKAKQTYVDAVEKLENSSSIHVPKKLVLFVGNLPEDITKEQIVAHFKRAGAGVKSVRLPKFRGTETGKGFGYVEFSSTIGHRIGLRLNNTTLAGRKIIVEFASEGKVTEKQLQEKLKQRDDTIPKMPFDS